MGRKPNPLIAEFFSRGPKLDNNSNRYRQTCRACHQEFPKGRADVLGWHLLQCVGLSLEDQARVNAQLYPEQAPPTTFPADASNEQSKNFDEHGAVTGFTTGPVQNGETRLGSSPTLYSHRKRKRGSARPVNLDQKRYEATFQLQSGLQDTQGWDSRDDGISETVRIGHMDEDRMQEDLQHITEGPKDHRQAVLGDTTGHPDDGLTSDQLTLAAAVANDLIAPDLDAGEESLLNPGESTDVADETEGNLQNSHAGSLAFPAIDPLLDGPNDAPTRARELSPRKPPQQLVFHHIRRGAEPGAPHAPYLHDFSIHADGEKNTARTRNKFSDDRRKEVKEIRKQGACIRCRMLKKPCSEDTPCSACLSVDAARLWRTPCTRSRIADEFDLLRDNLHLLISVNELRFVENACVAGPSTPGIIEVTLFPDDDHIPPAHFRSVRRQTLSTVSGQCATPLRATPADESPVNAQWLFLDHSNIIEKLASYLQSNDRLYCECESSHFMRETLGMAYEMLDERDDELLRNAVLLWSSVAVFTDPHRTWHISSQPVESGNMGEEHQEAVPASKITAEAHPLSYRLVTGQLNEFMEKRAFILCRSVMQDFEKRLIQRQKVHQQQFETFLAALVLMNCIEKLCWLFNTWVMDEDKQMEHRRTGADGSQEVKDTIATARGVWPLPTSPKEYLAHGEAVADTIAMLMKMRELPPPLAVDREKFLVADLTKKPPKGARYDASGYKGPAVRQNERSSKSLTGLDALFGSTSLGSRSLVDKEYGEGLLASDLFSQEPVDEHQASLIAQLHRDLQANGLSLDLGRSDLSADSTVLTGPETRDIDIDTILGLHSQSRDHAGHREEAHGSTEEFEERTPPTLEDVLHDSPIQTTQPQNNNERVAEHAAADVSASTAAKSLGEDPLLAHLRQAAEEAAKETQEDEYDDDIEIPQADVRASSDQPPRTPPVDVWFARIKLKVEDVIRAREKPPWDAKDPRCWELKYISRMLLPDKPVAKGD